MSGAAGAGSFGALTETPGTPVSPEGADMIRTRYEHGARLAEGRRTLEVACGAGVGLPLVAGRADRAVGLDVDPALLRRAARTTSRPELVAGSADALPFAEGAFGAVLFFEASYYVPRVEEALDEVARVLGREGVVGFVNANPERPAFVRSPHSHRYHTADELREALEERGFEVTVEGAFPAGEGGVAGRLASAARRLLEATGLMPRTLEGRARLKRLIHGDLPEVPADLSSAPDFGRVADRHPVGPGPAPGYKVLYVTGRRSP